MKRARGLTLGAMWAIALCASAAAEPSATPAEPPATTTVTVARCVESHERARLLKVNRQLTEALEAVKGCLSAECPLAIRADCNDWTTEIANLLPSVVLVIEGADDEQRARVFVDGELVEPSAAGAPIVLAPGEHHLRLELPPHPPIEQALVLGEGEKNRVVRVRFDAGSAAPAPLAPRDVAPPSEPQDQVPALTYVLASGALLSAAASGILLGSALTDRSRARDTCAPTCSSATRESIDRRLMFADISGGVALTLAGLAVYTYVARPKPSRATAVRRVPTWDIAIGDGALGVRVGGAF